MSISIPAEMAMAADLCARHYIPFALFRLPSSGRGGEWRFMASLPEPDGTSPVSLDADASALMDPASDCFFISRYGADEPHMAGVRAQFDAEGIISHLTANPNVRFGDSQEKTGRRSTNYAAWLEAFKRVRAFVQAEEGSKVVLSRMVALFSAVTPVEVVEMLARVNPPGQFTYLCFTPENGLWYGSTPELLLEQAPGGEYRTMALAGTLPASSDLPWDAKNKAEQAIVADFICGTLADLGLEVTRGRRKTLQTGIVRHLCTPIKATGAAPFGEVLEALNPTPAVAGLPRDVAMAVIDASETHQRRCYAGAVGARVAGRTHAYVNLRCGFATPAIDNSSMAEGHLHNIFGGGGIMPDSDEETEWSEVDAKLATLIAVLTTGLDDPATAFDVSDVSLTEHIDLPF
ncbi:MAG: chorismate-binding protein [Duncaniella sp.]|nr:chorismate-binding protein [Duncaniella sp.]